MNLTPLTRRRLASFRANKRGFWSLRIFCVLLVLSLLAELIANDKPLLLGYDNQVFMPILFRYSETAFGGVLHSEAAYRDPEVKALIEARHGWMLWPPVPFSYDTIDWQINEPVPSPPSARHWLGTDNVARDVMARIIYGFRLSVLFGLALTILSSVVGIGVGAVQGFFWRLGGPDRPAPGRNLGGYASAVPVDHSGEPGADQRIHAARPAAAIFLDAVGGGGQG